jgi:hypothetical protein
MKHTQPCDYNCLLVCFSTKDLTYVGTHTTITFYSRKTIQTKYKQHRHQQQQQQQQQLQVTMEHGTTNIERVVVSGNQCWWMGQMLTRTSVKDKGRRGVVV